MRRRRRTVQALGLAAGLVVAALVAAKAEQIGTAGAVNPAAQSAPPGGAMRTMNVGGNIVFKERINTSDSGSVQLVFVDRTTLNIGPNSQLTIDEFVYDPKANTGRMTATLTKGVMRFVGGQASHTGGATIKTPATTLGVRGGVVTVRHDQQNGTRAINHFGVMTAQSGQGTEVIRRPGFALNVANNAAPPSAPARAPQSEIDANNRQLTSAPQQTG
ncbi:MAG TPA: FecR family protein, partial [Beijerinckiaceae bacterium]|nr:FecR family protein [Beijerinckiaceae bacterium]